jgi:hypothetical protein
MAGTESNSKSSVISMKCLVFIAAYFSQSKSTDFFCLSLPEENKHQTSDHILNCITFGSENFSPKGRGYGTDDKKRKTKE